MPSATRLRRSGKLEAGRDKVYLVAILCAFNIREFCQVSCLHIGACTPLESKLAGKLNPVRISYVGNVYAFFCFGDIINQTRQID